MVAVGLINTHNNQTDRQIDRHNQSKNTLAIHHPVRNHQVVTVGGSVLALLLRQIGYSYLLLSTLYYVGVFYNYFLGRVPILKRLAVAIVVAATSFLAIDHSNALVWIWAGAVGLFIYCREVGKDRADAQEDAMARFFRMGAPVDSWCIIAPFAGVVIYITATLLLGVKPTSTHWVISLGTALTIFSFMQIRARHGWYRMRFPHRLIAGQSGLTLALAALMPPFATGILPIVVFNLATIYVRSCLPARSNVSWWANMHDAWLWASLVWLAMLGPGVFSLSAITLSLVVLVTVFVWEYRRTRRLQPV
jgi:hypothetical protein